MKKIIVCFFFVCSCALYADHFRDAMVAYKSGNFSQAKELFELSVKQENAIQGYYYLGKMYLYGEGVESNAAIAIPYLEQAVMKGNIKAKCYLAEAYLRNKTKQNEAHMLLNQGARESQICKEIAAAHHIPLKAEGSER